MRTEVFYHVTFANRLPGIVKEGLIPGRRITVRWKKEVVPHVANRLFFTQSIEEAKAHGNTIVVIRVFDSRKRTVPVPVLLRVARYKGRLWTDPVGTTTDVFGTEPVPPEDIEIWDPRRLIWSPLSETPAELPTDFFEVNPEDHRSLFSRLRYYLEVEWPESGAETPHES